MTKNKNKGKQMIPTKTNLMLFVAMTLSTGLITAMEGGFYKMTIENQLHPKMFLNVEDPNFLTDQSPYAYVRGHKTKTFLLSSKEIAHQTIAIPGGYPVNKVQLPIEKKETRFIIKDAPDHRQKLIIEDDSKNIIAELIVLSNPKK
jgi:hypothetical protein